MMDVTQALHLNNQGVSYLRQHQPQFALICFSKSVKILKQLQAWAETTAATTITEDEHAAPDASMTTDQSDQNDIIQNNALKGVVVPGLTSIYQKQSEQRSSKISLPTPNYIVPCALTFPLTSASNSIPALCTYSASVVWNIALLHHLRACQQSASQVDDRQKAVCMYEIVNQCLQASIGQLPKSISLLLRICTLNNLAHLFLSEGGDTGCSAVSNKAFRGAAALFNRGRPFMNAVLGPNVVQRILDNIVSAAQQSIQGAAAA